MRIWCNWHRHPVSSAENSGCGYTTLVCFVNSISPKATIKCLKDLTLRKAVDDQRVFP